MTSFFGRVGEHLRQFISGEPLTKALQRNTQAAHALDAVVKEMLKP
jgi:hypothetical protein